MTTKKPRAASKQRAPVTPPVDNGVALRRMIDAAGLTQAKALELVNEGQAFPIAESTWKSYLAAHDSKRRRPCPENVLVHAQRVFSAAAVS